MLIRDLLELHKIKELSEAQWSADVKEKWHPPEGFFTKSAIAIAVGLKNSSKDLKQAMSRLNFYINRAGSNLSNTDQTRLEKAKKELHDLFR